jgi:haemagglutination activity domain.
MSLVPTLAFAGGSIPPGVNQIVPDGRTATNVQSSGSVTTITTATVSGQTGFNSFSQFREGTGNTVNMALPGGTSNLVNVVRDGPAVVKGVLNSYKDGKIGGNVYFADPYGFVLGRSGVINTGTLNVSTPSKAFVDGLIGPQGQINATATNQLMNGNVPLSPDGFIAIRGRVNALEGARLIGQNVSVGPRSRSEAAQLDHAGKFAASVNSKGLRPAPASWCATARSRSSPATPPGQRSSLRALANA